MRSAPASRSSANSTLPRLRAHLTRGSFGRPAQAPARFKIGDRVRTRNIHPATHTRLPRYARGRVGVIEASRGCHVFPDSVAIGAGEDPQWLYTVLFAGRELWGENADPTLNGLDRSIRAVSGGGVANFPSPFRGGRNKKREPSAEEG